MTIQHLTAKSMLAIIMREERRVTKKQLTIILKNGD